MRMQRKKDLMPQVVPASAFKALSTFSIVLRKANRLTEHGNDNAKRRDIILKVLKTEDQFRFRKRILT